MQVESASSLKHLVVPGQVIATASLENKEESFLRGHGTYVETTENEQRLVASVTGIVQRVNKLIRVEAVADSVYNGHVGDLVVGRITGVQQSRWKVQLVPNSREAALPLSGVHLPGGVQRIRTAEDARSMRDYLMEGDLVSAEVHKVQQDGSLSIHTRSFRYGKLENGYVISVPPKLIPRQKNHYTTFMDQFDVLWGCNGMIWMQRKMQQSDESSVAGPELVELQEARRKEHASMPMTKEERLNLSRLRNSIECLRLVHYKITSETVEEVYKLSIEKKIRPAQMLDYNKAIMLTEHTRKK